jgi:hypothetical protein
MEVVGMPSVFTTLILSYSRIIKAGPTQNCVTDPKTVGGGMNDFTVTANVADVLQTCQPWEFTMKGGVPPYILTLVSPNTIVNASFAFDGDVFTYINRADPGIQMIGA